jgi:hypothetical protein
MFLKGYWIEFDLRFSVPLAKFPRRHRCTYTHIYICMYEFLKEEYAIVKSNSGVKNEKRKRRPKSSYRTTTHALLLNACIVVEVDTSKLEKSTLEDRSFFAVEITSFLFWPLLANHSLTSDLVKNESTSSCKCVCINM